MRQFSIGDIRWGRVALGWIIAVIVEFIIGLILTAIGLGVSSQGNVTAGIFITSIIAGFLGYVVGGYVAGRQAGIAGPLNGLMTAVFGILVFIVLTIIVVLFGAIFFNGQNAGTPGFLGYAGGGFVTVLIALIFNLLGGYLGGRLSGNASPRTSNRPGRVR